jgi:excisionase family DNA binding protein
MATDPILYLRFSEIAALFRVSRRTVNRWVTEGRLQAITLPSGRRMVPARALRDLVLSKPRRAEER